MKLSLLDVKKVRGIPARGPRFDLFDWRRRSKASWKPQQLKLVALADKRCGQTINVVSQYHALRMCLCNNNHNPSYEWSFIIYNRTLSRQYVTSLAHRFFHQYSCLLTINCRLKLGLGDNLGLTCAFRFGFILKKKLGSQCCSKPAHCVSVYRLYSKLSTVEMFGWPSLSLTQLTVTVTTQLLALVVTPQYVTSRDLLLVEHSSHICSTNYSANWLLFSINFKSFSFN